MKGREEIERKGEKERREGKERRKGEQGVGITSCIESWKPNECVQANVVRKEIMKD